MARADDRVPSTSPNIQWTAHRDNPLLQGRSSHYFINSDLAFSGDYLVQGNYDGFSVWDIADPSNPTLTSVVECAGGQGDVSVVGSLVILSVDDTMASDRCDAARVSETTPHWDGIRIFDISHPASPQYVASVQTRCGSHTNTVLPTADPKRVYVYVDAYSRGVSTTCTGQNPLDIVEVDLNDPAAAHIAASVDLFAGREAFGPNDLVPGGAETRFSTGCHDITVFGNRAAAACRGDGLLLDVSDPLRPTVLQQVRDPEMSFWHSAIFSNDGSLVLFQDEMGDGQVNTCSAATPATRGTDAIWSLKNDALSPLGYFKIPREQPDSKRCTAHNGSIVPVPGRNILVQAWYEGGVSLVDFTDPAHPTEIGYFEWPPYANRHEYSAGYWSAYFYNGHIYASDMWGGLDVLTLVGDEFADAARYSAASLNPQTQPAYDWVWKHPPTLSTDTESQLALTLSPERIPAQLATPSATDGGERMGPKLSVSSNTNAFEPMDTIDIWFQDRVLATVRADEGGALTLTEVTLPADLPAGTYTLIARGDHTPDTLATANIVIEPPPSNSWVGILLSAAGAVLVAGVGIFWAVRRRRNGVVR
ncbi:MAG: LVIVD repeat-containing protein [Agromyces sp.]